MSKYQKLELSANTLVENEHSQGRSRYTCTCICTKKKTATVTVPITCIVVVILILSLLFGLLTKYVFTVTNQHDHDHDPPSLFCTPNYTYLNACPGNTIICTCHVEGNSGFTQWKFQTPNRTLTLCENNDNIISLMQRRYVCSDKNGTCGNLLYAENVQPSIHSNSCQISNLTIKVYPILNGLLVTCHDTSFGGVNTTVNPIKLTAAPGPPIITSLTSTYYNELTVKWINEDYTNYSVSINDSNATDVLLGYKDYPYPNAYTFTTLRNNTAYSIRVGAINCIGNSNVTTVTARTSGCPSLRLTKPSITTPLCPNDTVEYTCTINSLFYNTSMIWNGFAFNCPEKNNNITLIQASNGSLNTSPVECGKASAKMTNINGTCYTSVLTLSNPINFNGSTIQCYDGNTKSLVGSEILQQEFKAAPSPLQIHANSSTSAITVGWNFLSSANEYIVSINGSNYMNSSSVTSNMYTFKNLTSNTAFIVSVVAINCAGSKEASMVSQTSASSSSSSTLEQATDSSLAIGLGLGLGLGLPIVILIIIIIIIIVVVVCRSKEAIRTYLEKIQRWSALCPKKMPDGQLADPTEDRGLDTST